MAKLRFYEDKFEFDTLLEAGLDVDYGTSFAALAPFDMFRGDISAMNFKADFFPNIDYSKDPNAVSEDLTAPELLTQEIAQNEDDSAPAQAALQAPINGQVGFEPIDPNNAMDWDEPLNTNPTFTSMHVFSTADIVGTFEGLTQGDIEPGDTPIIDFSATPMTTKDGVDLFPINSEFGFIVTDFDGAVQKDFEDNPEYTEGWASDLTDAMGNHLGLVVSDAPTDTFATPAKLGTWLAGLGGNTVKASTEHYSVMQEILSDQMYPDDPNAVYQLDDNLKMIGGEYDGMFIADILPLVGDVNGDGVMDIKDVLQPNESTIASDIAVGDDYSVTMKDDGKLLYRWGNTVKRPNDIRIEAELDLPDEWKTPDRFSDTPDLNPLYRVTSAELVVHHTITNNPNDQLRPEDYENESAIGTLPEYEILPDGRWVSVDGYFAGDGSFYPAGTVLRDPGLAALAEGSTLDQIGAMSSDLTQGFTNEWYTTMNREPFEPVLNDDGTEYVTGPRWRLQPDKYGQDLPSVVIPQDPGITANPTKDQVKYEVGMETQTVINLLDWANPVSPLSISAGWLNGSGTTTENGVTLSDNFDLAVYIKGDIKPATIYSAQLVMDYEEIQIYDFGDTVTGGLEDDYLVGQGNNNFFGGVGADFFVLSYGAASPADIQSSIIMDFEAGVDTVGLIDLDVYDTNFDAVISQTVIGSELFIYLNGVEVARLLNQTETLDFDSFVLLNTDPGSENQIIGTEGDDTLYGDAEANIISGLGGNDRLFGQAGDDVLDGNDGNDLLWGGEGADEIIGGAGLDRAMYSLADSGVVVSLETGGSAGEALGDIFSGVENLGGSAFDDTLSGDSLNNLLYGYAGNDTLNGGGGNDGLYGYAGDDTLNGEAGNDRLFGHDGDDLLDGGDGDDSLWGGVGADTMIGGAGVDTAMYTLATAGVTVSLETGGTAGEALGDTFSDVENLGGTTYDDNLAGDATNNILRGYAGNDVLYGSGGNDRLYGYDGDDALDGGAGNDLLFGGAGADLFVFTDAAFGQDAISGFEDGTDLFDFTALGLDFGDFAKSQVGANTVLTLLSDPAQTVTLYGVDESLIDAADFYDGGMI